MSVYESQTPAERRKRRRRRRDAVITYSRGEKGRAGVSLSRCLSAAAAMLPDSVHPGPPV